MNTLLPDRTESAVSGGGNALYDAIGALIQDVRITRRCDLDRLRREGISATVAGHVESGGKIFSLDVYQHYCQLLAVRFCDLLGVAEDNLTALASLSQWRQAIPPPLRIGDTLVKIVPVLAAGSGETHCAYDVATELRIVQANVTHQMLRLASIGWLVDAGSQALADPRRRYYRVTADGTLALGNIAHALRHIHAIATLIPYRRKEGL